MSIVYLNGDYLPQTEARISPMDRGFLFGDGIYEVVPSFGGRLVGFGPHIDRMQEGLAALEIDSRLHSEDWQGIARELIARNGGGDMGLYLHVSRGADNRRDHAYPASIAPTVFAFTFPFTAPPSADPAQARVYRVATEQDLRWRRCQIKSTALLGNVMHLQAGQSRGNEETILYNDLGEVTEAAACNVFVVTAGAVATPPLDNQKLPGITRLLLLDILRRHSDIPVAERVVTLAELQQADEVWLTSSGKEVAPVVAVDGKPVGDGKPGPVWQVAQSLYSQHKFNY